MHEAIVKCAKYKIMVDVPTRTKVGIEKRTVDSNTVLKAAMSGQGAIAIHLVPQERK